MIYSVNRLYPRQRLRLGIFALLTLGTACGGSDNLSPSSQAPADGSAADDSLAAAPIDSSAIGADSTIGTSDSTVSSDTSGVTLSGTTVPGIVFAVMGMRSQYISVPYNGSKEGVDPSYTLRELDGARAKGARVILELASGPDWKIQNDDGTFSFTKWKALVDRFKTINFSSYLTDGTLMGHFLIDEPHNASKWGGKVIPQTTVEAMAKYSKQLWPGLTTFAREAPSWLAKASISYTYLDASWAQYAAYQGDATKWIAAEVTAAKGKGLGLAVGLNMLNGGNGSSGIPGTRKGKYSMSASELKNYGTALLNQTLACGFFSWSYLETGATYLARSDIKSAMTDLSYKAKNHTRTSCRQ